MGAPSLEPQPAPPNDKFLIWIFPIVVITGTKAGWQHPMPFFTYAKKFVGSPPPFQHIRGIETTAGTGFQSKSMAGRTNRENP